MSRWNVAIIRSLVGLVACAGLVFVTACQTTTRRTVRYYQFSDVPVTNDPPQALLDAQNRMLQEGLMPKPGQTVPPGQMLAPGQMIAPGQMVPPAKMVPVKPMKPTSKGRPQG